MITVYADVLIILNIYVNFLLLKATSAFTHIPLKSSRCILASVYGSLFSLTILLPPLNTAVNILIKLFAAVSVVYAAFGFFSVKRLAVNSVAFFIINLVAGGFVYAVYVWLEADFIHFNNSFFYIDFSLVILVVTVSVFYFAVCIFRNFSEKTALSAGIFRVIIRYGHNIISLNGLADTGNSLRDFFSGSPVIVCGQNCFKDITGKEPSENYDSLPEGFRLIPCSTINESCLIPVFRPDEILIINEKNHFRKKVDALIGFGKEQSDAIFNPSLLKM